VRKASLLVPLVILLAVLLVSCEKTQAPERPLSEIDSGVKTIPMQYGNLVDVTSVPEHRNWYQLWFQAEDGTIRMVRFRVTDDIIHKVIEEIPRSQPAAMEGQENEG
jgi:hypothetical protein